ncbi:hypothetical protein ACTHAM_002336 [Cellulomonas soli]|uniref:hypothetical protein n=1 Tax=Cellulomonas soli TaxID=931535 RepID=UPI003F84A774
MFDAPLNADVPRHIPVKPQGRIPVLARLVLLGGAFWVPARAIRWTQTHVMVVITDDELTTREHLVWLRAADVRRRLPA